MAITRVEARIITEEIRTAVTAILDSHDLTVGDVRSNYGDNYGFKVTATKVVLGEDGFDYGTKEAQEWLLTGSGYGFVDPRGVLGKVVTVRGTEYAFMGYSSRSPKYPLRFKRMDDGRTYKFPQSALHSLR